MNIYITAYLYDMRGCKVLEPIYDCGRFIYNAHSRTSFNRPLVIDERISMHAGFGSVRTYAVVDADSRTAILQEVA